MSEKYLTDFAMTKRFSFLIVIALWLTPCFAGSKLEFEINPYVAFQHAHDNEKLQGICSYKDYEKVFDDMKQNLNGAIKAIMRPYEDKVEAKEVNWQHMKEENEGSKRRKLRGSDERELNGYCKWKDSGYCWCCDAYCDGWRRRLSVTLTEGTDRELFSENMERALTNQLMLTCQRTLKRIEVDKLESKSEDCKQALAASLCEASINLVELD